MTDSPISTFIAHARSKDMDPQTIRMLLLSAGWKEKDISQALASQALDMPVPMPPDAGSARDAFFHLLSFTALTATVVSLIFLYFDFLNRLLPDAALGETVVNTDVSGVRWELAVLFVSFPLFVWMSRILQKEFAAHPEKLASGVRRWLTYLTLFVTACTLVGDSIALIFSLLQGEVTVRFFLKVIVIFVLAGLPFNYYFHALRLQAEQFTRNAMHRIYLWTGAAIVLLAIVAGFVVAGSPLRGRAEQFDAQRLSDLRGIESEALNIAFGGQRGMPTPLKELPKPLPATLDDVAKNAVYQKLQTTDPETGAPYVYAVTSPHTFDLCADFALPRDLSYDIFWNHPAGHSCFSIDALDTQKQ